jgi:hypothetical protein
VPLAVQRGRCVTFANEIGRLAWRFRLPDHARLIANAVRSGAPHAYPAALGQDLPVSDGRVTVPVLHTWEIVALEV